MSVCGSIARRGAAAGWTTGTIGREHVLVPHGSMRYRSEARGRAESPTHRAIRQRRRHRLDPAICHADPGRRRRQAVVEVLVDEVLGLTAVRHSARLPSPVGFAVWSDTKTNGDHQQASIEYNPVNVGDDWGFSCDNLGKRAARRNTRVARARGRRRAGRMVASTRSHGITQHQTTYHVFALPPDRDCSRVRPSRCLVTEISYIPGYHTMLQA